MIPMTGLDPIFTISSGSRSSFRSRDSDAPEVITTVLPAGTAITWARWDECHRAVEGSPMARAAAHPRCRRPGGDRSAATLRSRIIAKRPRNVRSRLSLRARRHAAQRTFGAQNTSSSCGLLLLGGRAAGTTCSTHAPGRDRRLSRPRACVEQATSRLRPPPSRMKVREGRRESLHSGSRKSRTLTKKPRSGVRARFGST